MVSRTVKSINVMEITSSLLEVGNNVKMPFNGKGKVVEIKNIPWGSKYIVEVTEENYFYNIGDIEDFKREMLIKII